MGAEKQNKAFLNLFKAILDENGLLFHNSRFRFSAWHYGPKSSQAALTPLRTRRTGRYECLLVPRHYRGYLKRP